MRRLNWRFLAVLVATILIGVSSRAGADEPATRPSTTRPVAATPAVPAPAPVERPPRPDDPFIQAQRNSRQQMKAQYTGMKVQATLRLDRLVQFHVEHGRMQVELAPVGTNALTRVKVDGSDAIWMVMRQQLGFNMLANASPMMMLHRFDFDKSGDEQTWATYLTANDRMITIMGQSVFNRISLTQNGDVIGFSVLEWKTGAQPPKILFKGDANSLDKLRAEHPVEFRKFVIPLLERFSDMAWLRPGPADVYSVFPEIPADERVSRQVRALLPQLDAISPADRDVATAQLEQLGPAGMLAVLRLDGSDLSAEQRQRLANFVAHGSHEEIADMVAMRRDPVFLLNCLEFEDPAGRAAAKRELEKLLGHPIAFNVAQTVEAATPSVDALRKAVLVEMPAATQPATRPAGQPGAIPRQPAGRPALTQ